jgi:hypothetical protein
MENSEENPPRQRRREARIRVTWPVTVEKVADRSQALPEALAKVYERVAAEPTDLGKFYKSMLRDVSMNGAFIDGDPLPLLSRVAVSFEVPNYRRVEAIGWVMWRRREACVIENGEQKLELAAGYGILFEWCSLEARLEIARRIARGIGD